MLWILWVVLGAVALLLIVILARAAAFKPKTDAERISLPPVSADGEAAVGHLAEMIRCKTVSTSAGMSLGGVTQDEAEFDKFRALLRELYPELHRQSVQERIGPSGLLYKIKGKSDKLPSVFMAHYDVVPVDESGWQHPPFCGEVIDGVLWGRGALDTKITLLGAIESTENLLKQGFVPENDVYLSFSGDEEISGDSAPAIVAELKKRGITPALVVDEGGAVVKNVFPGVKEECALIGISEKGMLNVEFSMESSGGHASAPPPHTIIGELSAACEAVENHPLPAEISPAIAEMFDTLGRRSTFAMKLIFANLWCFKPILDKICKKSGGELNAMLRTTCAFTMCAAGQSANVLPPEARLVANLRLNGSSTVDSAIAHLKKTIGNDKIKIKAQYGMNPSKVSKIDTDGWKKLCAAVGGTWPDAVISPYMMLQCSDSRHFCAISDNVYRFSAMALTKEERGLIHGNNERIPVETVKKTVEFYTRLISQC